MMNVETHHDATYVRVHTQLIGARVYEEADYEKAIELVTVNELPFENMITAVQPLDKIQSVFENIDKNPDGMKVLLDIQN